MLSHNTLVNYYQSIFAMAQHHNYSLTELEELLPYERDIYMEMLIDHLEEVKEKSRSKR